MRRQIIQTQTKGWTPAMRRNALAAIVAIAALVLIVAFVLHGHSVVLPVK